LHLAVSHLVVKPRFRHPQVTPHRNRRNIERLGDFFHRKSAKVAQFYRLALSRIELLQGAETKVQSDELRTSLLLKADRLIERYRESCAFPRVSATRVVHQDLTHQTRCHAEKMRPVLPVGVLMIHKPQVSLIDQRRRLQSVALTLFSQVTRRKQTKLLIDDWREVLTSLLIPVRPLGK